MRTFPVGHTTYVSGEGASFAITDAGADFALASTKVHSPLPALWKPARTITAHAVGRR